jgi:hypothetical protein
MELNNRSARFAANAETEGRRRCFINVICMQEKGCVRKGFSGLCECISKKQVQTQAHAK